MVLRLTTGRLSDHLGRRPVVLFALVVQIASMVAFIAARGVGMLFEEGACRLQEHGVVDFSKERGRQSGFQAHVYLTQIDVDEVVVLPLLLSS